MKTFELGKCYRHGSGQEMHICGLSETFMYGTSFVAELSDSSELKPIAMNDKDACANWIEITREEFFSKNFS